MFERQATLRNPQWARVWKYDFLARGTRGPFFVSSKATYLSPPWHPFREWIDAPTPWILAGHMHWSYSINRGIYSTKKNTCNCCITFWENHMILHNILIIDPLIIFVSPVLSNIRDCIALPQALSQVHAFSFFLNLCDLHCNSLSLSLFFNYNLLFRIVIPWDFCKLCTLGINPRFEGFFVPSISLNNPCSGIVCVLSY